MYRSRTGEGGGTEPPLNTAQAWSPGLMIWRALVQFRGHGQGVVRPAVFRSKCDPDVQATNFGRTLYW